MANLSGNWSDGTNWTQSGNKIGWSKTHSNDVEENGWGTISGDTITAEWTNSGGLNRDKTYSDTGTIKYNSDESVKGIQWDKAGFVRK